MDNRFNTVFVRNSLKSTVTVCYVLITRQCSWYTPHIWVNDNSSWVAEVSDDLPSVTKVLTLETYNGDEAKDVVGEVQIL